MSRAWDQSATDMRRSFQTGTGSTWNGLADDARRTFARSWDQSASDMRQAFQRGASGAASSAADDMRRDFARGWDRSAEDMRDSFRRAAQQAGGDMSDAMRDAGRSAGQQGGDAAGEGVASGIKGKAGAIAAGVGAAFAIVGGLAANQFIDAFGSALDKEKSLDLAQARLGVDEQTASRIGAAAGAAYGDAFGESVGENIDTARMAIQAGLLDPSATSRDIQTVISQLSGLTDFMGGDLQETAKAAGNLVKTGLVANTSEAFDVLTAGYHAVGLQGDDLVDSVKEYSAGWAQTGLDGKTAMALIAQSIDLGSDSTDRAADALREFGRRMYEESDTIKETLGTLGLPADELFDKLKAGGPEAVTAFDQVFDAIRAIKDPLDKANAAQALLGDTAGDFIGAFTSWDPSEAVAKFGDISGAAQGVINTMSGNAATSIDSAKRSWELAMSEVGGAFANAFGPELAKLADWISSHQPEILGFLSAVTDGAFLMTGGFLSFASNSLRAIAMFAETAAPMIGRVVEPLGKVTEVLGRITGNSDLQDIGKAMQEVDNQFQGVADGAYSMADTIDNKAIPGLERMWNSVGDNIAQAQNAETVMRALGDSVTSIPTEHGIIISENSPEITQRLEALGLKVTTLPDKRVEVTANTASADQMMRDFIARNGGQQLKVDVLAVYRGVTTGGSAPLAGNAHGTDALGIRGIPGLSGGGRAGRTIEGVLWGPGTPTSDSILGVGADGIPTARVSRGEGVVREDMMRRGGGQVVEALNRGWVPPADFVRDIVRGGARLWHGDYNGSLNRIGIAEDDSLVAGAIGLRDLLVKGDYSKNLRDATGLEEDHPLISAVLGGRSLAHGNYDPRLRTFGLEEDHPLVAAGLGAGALLGRGNYDPNLRQFGIEEDNPLVDAGIGLGALSRGDYSGNLRRFGLEEDNPLIGAALGARNWLANLPNLAGGGVAGQRATSWAHGKNGLPYIYGPQDCSWYQSGIYNQLTGKSVRFTTASDLASFGFKRGSDPTGFTVGTNGGTGEGGHMTGRLLGVAVESDGTNGVQFGGSADGPEGMPQQWFLPRDLWQPPATDDTSLGSGGGVTGNGTVGGKGGAPGGGASSGSGGGSTGGGTYGGQEIPAGVTPVWIVGGGAANTSTLEATAPTTSAAASSSGTAAADTGLGKPVDVNGRLQGMAADFGNSNFDQFLGDLGFRREGGALQGLVKVIQETMAWQTAQALKQAAKKQESIVGQYGFGPR